MQYSGFEWLERQRFKKDHWKHGKEVSPLGREVADLLGQVYFGLYHLDSRALERVDWSDPHWCSIVLRYGSLATWDFNTLTQLVVLCHDRLLRFEVQGCGPNLTRLSFWKRTSRTGGTSDRLPTMEDHIKLIRDHHGESLPVLDGEVK